MKVGKDRSIACISTIATKSNHSTCRSRSTFNHPINQPELASCACLRLRVLCPASDDEDDEGQPTEDDEVEQHADKNDGQMRRGKAERSQQALAGRVHTDLARCTTDRISFEDRDTHELERIVEERDINEPAEDRRNRSDRQDETTTNQEREQDQRRDIRSRSNTSDAGDDIAHGGGRVRREAQ